MRRLLQWLWYPDGDTSVVKAFSWTEMLVDRAAGRSHVWIINPGCWLLGRLMTLPSEAYRGDNWAND